MSSNHDSLMRKGNAQKQLNRIYIRDNGICQHCMQPCSREDASRGHIIDVEYCDRSLARSDENIQLEHVACNLAKNKEKMRLRRQMLHQNIGDLITMKDLPP